MFDDHPARIYSTSWLLRAIAKPYFHWIEYKINPKNIFTFSPPAAQRSKINHTFENISLSLRVLYCTWQKRKQKKFAYNRSLCCERSSSVNLCTKAVLSHIVHKLQKSFPLFVLWWLNIPNKMIYTWNERRVWVVER